MSEEKQTSYLVRFLRILAIVLLTSPMLGVAIPETNNPFLSTIQDSFATKAFAEPGYYGGCYNTSFSDDTEDDVCANDGVIIQNYCLLENTTTPISGYIYRRDTPSISVETSVNQHFSTPTPVLGIAPASMPSPPTTIVDSGVGYETIRATHTASITTPAGSAGQTVLITFNAGNTNGAVLDVHGGEANILIVAPNNAPVLSNPLPVNFSFDVGNGQYAQLPVSVEYNDSDGHAANLTFELSKDNFSTIEKSVVLTNVASGSTANAEFTDLAPGEYSWRVSATEIGTASICDGRVAPDPNVGVVLAAHTTQTSEITTVNITGDSPSDPETELVQTGLAKPMLSLGVLVFTCVNIIATFYIANSRKLYSVRRR